MFILNLLILWIVYLFFFVVCCVGFVLDLFEKILGLFFIVFFVLGSLLFIDNKEGSKKNKDFFFVGSKKVFIFSLIGYKLVKLKFKFVFGGMLFVFIVDVISGSVEDGFVLVVYSLKVESNLGKF